MERALRWLREAAITAGLIVRQSALSLRANWGIGLLSLALALSLWVYVTDRENPERTARVPGTVPVEVVNVPAGQAVLSISQESVTVRARASESVFEELTAQDFRATVDLATATAREVRADVSVESQEPRADFVDATPSFVVVTLEGVRSQTVPVRAVTVGTVPRGFDVGQITVQPAEAEVTGPETLVNGVAELVAEVNLTGANGSFTETVALQPRNDAGLAIEGVQVQPENAEARVEVRQLEFSRAFVVAPEVTGVPAEGYQVTSLSADPPLVTVTGSIEELQAIDAVEGLATAPVSVDGATTDVVRTVALRLPEGVTADVSSVTVRAAIAPAAGQFTFSVAPRLLNLPSGLTATPSPATVQVVLAGPVLELASLDAANIVAALDLSDLAPGQHDVPIRVQAPSGATVVSVTPPTVTVTVQPP